jgi:surface polysaccharide O-acyltransferase-like enzyme
VVAGYLDSQSRHDAQWQMGKIKSVVIVFLFWMTVYYLWEPYQRGYLIQPWFVFAFIVIYTFHPLIEWLSQRRKLFFGVVFALLLLSYGYDLLSALYPDVHALSLAPVPFVDLAAVLPDRPAVQRSAGRQLADPREW